MDPTTRPAKVTLGGHQGLRVWQSAVDLATECYMDTAGFPTCERFGLSAQMRAAAVSVVSNIAEGHGRGTRRAFASFLAVAHGPLEELEAQVILAGRLRLLSDGETASLLGRCNATGRMMHGLRRSLRGPAGAAGNA